MVVDANVIKSVAPGSVLLHAGAKLPTGVAFERRHILDVWVTDPGLKFTDFNAALDKVGWHCFFVPRETRAGALGLSDNHALSRALRKLAAHAERERLNALEVTTVQRRRLLGLYYAKVGANPRHVQSTLLLAPAAERLNSPQLKTSGAK